MAGFDGKVALVTGAASGIGAAVCARLQSSGATVFCADIDRRGAIELDVLDEAAWIAAIDTTGPLDLLVNCAGVSAASPVVDISLDEWRRVLAINLDGAFLATKHGIRNMRNRGGVIIHIGSASGIRPAAGAAAYSTSKAALRMLVRTAAKECRDQAIPVRINLVSPAGVKTPMWSSMPFFQEMAQRLGSEEAAYADMEESGGGRFLEPDAVARVVCFLAGDEARNITGVELPVDDGYVL
jgi:NAD(P)-dependent dehydrogenase (short-subunit alcohol dehydrogenase family)